MEMFQSFFRQSDDMHLLSLGRLHLAAHHADTLHLVGWFRLGRKKQVLQLLWWLSQKGEATGMVGHHILGPVGSDNADALVVAGHKIDVVY